MKDKIHPNYVVTKVTCGCGNSFVTRSTQPEMKIDICNVCHPFYTGKLKYVDTAGRIEKFQKKFPPPATRASIAGRRRQPPAKPPPGRLRLVQAHSVCPPAMFSRQLEPVERHTEVCLYNLHRSNGTRRVPDTKP